MAESTGILLLNAEDNDLSGLTITEEGSNSLSITGDAALHGSLGYEFTFSGNTGENFLYFSKSFTAGDDIYGRCYFYIPSSFDANSSTLSIFGLYYSSANLMVRPMFTTVSGGAVALVRLYYYLNTGQTFQNITAITINRDTLYCMELRCKSGNGDGVVTLWLDGTEITSITGLTNNNYQAGYVFAGNVMSCVPTSGSVIYVDDIKVDSSYIGAYAESGGALPAIINNYRQQGVM